MIRQRDWAPFCRHTSKLYLSVTVRKGAVTADISILQSSLYLQGKEVSYLKTFQNYFQDNFVN